MSEFTSYSFHAIDKALTPKQMEELSAMSSRFAPTMRSFNLNYSYSDFRYNADEVLLKYFDLLVYRTNWGTTRIVFKFPKGSVDYDRLRRYAIEPDSGYDEGIRVFRKAGFILVELDKTEEESYWIEEDDESLAHDCVHLRADILKGDLRPLLVPYLGFSLLSIADLADPDEREELPELPLDLITPGLDQLNTRLENLATVFDLDTYLLKALSIFQPAPLPVLDFDAALRQLSAKKKDKYLRQLLAGKSDVAIKLRKKLMELMDLPAVPKRSGTVDWDQIIEKLIMVREARAQEAERLAREKEEERLRDIAKNETRLYQETEELAESGRGKSYIYAVENIRQLRDLAVYRGTEGDFRIWLAGFRERFGSKRALVRRLGEFDQE